MIRAIGMVVMVAGLAAVAWAQEGGEAPPAAATQPAATQPAATQPQAEKWTTESGLTIIRVQPGTGDKVAKPGDEVSVHYVGRLQANDKQFDSSLERGDPIMFRLGMGRVIAGWEEGIEGMKVGEKRQLIIPPQLGYGKRGAGGGVIPPNATLVFDVELVGVRSPGE